MYYNYHKVIQRKIKNCELEYFEIVEEYHNINPALLLYFKDGTVKPIREKRWIEYFVLINKYFKKEKV